MVWFVRSDWRSDGHACTVGFESEVRDVGDIDLIIEEEETLGVDGPMWGQGVELGGCNQIRVELLNVHDDRGA